MKRSSRLCLALGLFALTGTAAYAITLSGKLVEADGTTPAAGITVQVEHHENRNAEHPDSFVQKVTSGADGAFTIDLPGGKSVAYIIFFADKTGHIYQGHAHVGSTTNYGTVKLARGGSLSGTVRGDDAKPLADAEVILEIRLQKYTCSHHIEAARTKSDAAGAFTFADLSPAEYRYKVSCKELGAESGTIEISEDPAFIDIRLKKGSAITGKVTDEAGKPVAGAVVRVSPKSTATTDAQGQFTLGGLPGGDDSMSITVSANGYTPKEGGYIQVKCKPGTTTTKNMTMMKAGDLAVTLTTTDKGMTIPEELQISLQPSSSSSRRSYFDTSREAALTNGTAVYSNVPPGKYQLSLSTEGLPSLSTNVTITAGKVTRQAMDIPRVFEVSGKVVDESGSGVAEGQVSLSPVKDEKADSGRRSRFGRYSSYSRDASVQTETNGTFTLKGVLPGKYTLAVQHEKQTGDSREIEVGPDKPGALTITLKKGLSINGIVTQADGKPAAGIRVYASYRPSMQEMRKMRNFSSTSRNVETGEDGKFELKGLQPGKYQIQFSSSTDMRGTTLAEMENVEAGAEDLIVSLGRTCTVSGIVSDAAGKPVADARFDVQKVEGDDDTRTMFSSYSFMRSGDDDPNKTGADGKFTVDLREGAAYCLSFMAPPLLPQQVTVDLSAGQKPPAAPIKVTMLQGCKLTGTVKYKAGGKPVTGVQVKAGARSGMMPYMPYMPGQDEDKDKEAGMTDAKGAFSLDGVPSGMVSIYIYGGTNEERRSVLATKNMMVVTGKVNTVQIELSDMGSVKGKALDADGNAIADCQVSLMPATGRRYGGDLSASTDEEGIFQMESVPAGKYKVMWFATTGDDMENIQQQKPVDITVGAGKTVEITLQAPKAGTAAAGLDIHGKVTTNGVVAKGGCLYLMPMPPGEDEEDDEQMAAGMYSMPKQVSVESNGTFSVSGVATGRYFYYYMTQDPDKMMEQESGDEMTPPVYFTGTTAIKAGQTNLALAITGGLISGKLSGKDGKGVSGAHVVAIPSGAKGLQQQMGSRYAMTKADGTYAMPCVPPGTYDFTFQGEDNFAFVKEVKVTGSMRVDGKTQSGAAVKGTVVDQDNKPLAMASIMMYSDNVANSHWEQTKKQGEFDFQPEPPPMTYRMYVTAEGYATDARSINLSGPTNLSIRLVPGGELEITVTRGGNPAKGETVRILDAKGKEVMREQPAGAMARGSFGSVMLTDAEGRTTVSGLAPGTYSVGIKNEKKTVKTEVKALETAEAQLAL